jgi:hypothetical protein
MHGMPRKEPFASNRMRQLDRSIAPAKRMRQGPFPAPAPLPRRKTSKAKTMDRTEATVRNMLSAIEAPLSRCTKIPECRPFVINHFPIFDCRFTALKSRNVALRPERSWRKLCPGFECKSGGTGKPQGKQTGSRP